MNNRKLYNINTISEFHKISGLPKPQHPLISVIDYSLVEYQIDEPEISWMQNLYFIGLKRYVHGKFFYGQSEYDFDDSLWQKQRFVSIGYYALYNPDNANLVVDELSEKCEWIYLSQLSEIDLAMDHREIIEKALLTLRERISYKPIGYNLLPEKFTLSELQKLYETILGKELNRGNFYRKIKNLGILRKLDEQRRGGAHKSPDLYTFDEKNYKKALENGLNNW